MKDSSFRSAQVVHEGAGGGRELFRVHRPPGNVRLETIHQGIPVTDRVYLVYGAPDGALVGVVQKPWLKGVWRDRWILREAAWAEVGCAEESSLVRALARTFAVSALPRRYDLTRDGRPAGRLHTSWDLGRFRIRADLRQDSARAIDRRVVIALLLLLLMH